MGQVRHPLRHHDPALVTENVQGLSEPADRWPPAASHAFRVERENIAPLAGRSRRGAENRHHLQDVVRIDLELLDEGHPGSRVVP